MITVARTPPSTQRSGFSLFQSQEATLAVFLIVLVAVIAVIAPAFLERQNIEDVLVNASFVAIASVGMTMVIVGGQIDISIGSILAVCAVLAGNLAVAGVPLIVLIPVTLIAGTLIGALNGLLVAYANIPSIIVTLGTLWFWRGLVITITKGAWIYNMPESFHFAQRDWLGVPIPVWIMLITVLGGGLFMKYRPLGRQIYAVGGNPQAALLAGVSVKRITFMTFALSGFFTAIAAILYASRFSVVQTNAGLGFEFQVITAVVVGGTSIMGGTGSVFGSLLGALLIAVIATGMTFMKVSAYWLQTVQGSLILLAVVADVLRRRRATR